MKKQSFNNSVKERRRNYVSSNDRRRGRDLLAKTLVVLNLAAWVMMVLILVVAERAKPQFESFFDRAYRLNIRNSWDVEFVHYLLWITMIGVLVSSAGLILSIFRARRREDSSRLGLLVMGIFSIVGLGTIFFFFIRTADSRKFQNLSMGLYILQTRGEHEEIFY